MAQIFEYAVVFQPKNEDETKEREKPKLVVDVTRVLASSQQEVTILASRSIPADYLDRLDEVEIAVRPF